MGAQSLAHNIQKNLVDLGRIYQQKKTADKLKAKIQKKMF